VIFDRDHLLQNAAGLKNDLEERPSRERKVLVKEAVL